MKSLWELRMSQARASGPADADGKSRTPWQRDYDRVLFSAPFRRLADKTQVFPLPVDDHVHSRLTHSLEVAAIGRSLGSRVGVELGKRKHLPTGVHARDIGDCVAAACLAHDLGNPPFGHVGERAIQEFFSTNDELTWDLTERQKWDLKHFEGNAQGFRTLTSRQSDWQEHGLDLTFSTLGAFMKYPRVAGAWGESERKSLAKHGVMDADTMTWKSVASALALTEVEGAGIAWARHPLAYLTEAADDIAYLLLDLEDGFRLEHLGVDDLLKVLLPVAKLERGHPAASKEAMARATQLDRAAFLRGRAVDTLIGEVASVFLEREESLLRSEEHFDRALREAIPSKSALQAIEEMCSTNCYDARDVLKMELTGAEAIQGLLGYFCAAIDDKSALRSKHLRKLYKFILTPEGSRYDQLVRITDHVAGMTDHYAVRLYRELRGVRYPGGRDPG